AVLSALLGGDPRPLLSVLRARLLARSAEPRADRAERQRARGRSALLPDPPSGVRAHSDRDPRPQPRSPPAVSVCAGGPDEATNPRGAGSRSGSGFGPVARSASGRFGGPARRRDLLPRPASEGPLD